MQASRTRPRPPAPPPKQAFLAFLASPVTALRSPRLHLLALRLLLVLALSAAAVALSGTSYFVLYFTWGRVPSFEAALPLSYGSGSPPFALVTLPSESWRVGQRYDVVVELDCPLTSANIALGNFMVHADILPSTGKTPLAQGEVATLLTPPPALSPRNVLPLVWGVPERTLALAVLEGVVLAPESGLRGRAGRLKVWVGREDGWEGSGKEVVTTAARVIVRGRLSGLRSILSNHPVLSLSALTSATLLTTLLASLLSFYLFSPSLPSFFPPRPTAEPAPKPALRSHAREREWARSLPRGGKGLMADLSSSEEEDEGAASDGERAQREREEERELERLRAKEDEVRRVREALEDVEEREAEARAREREAERERAVAARATAAAAASAREKEAGGDDGESLLGGSGTTPSRRSFGATTAASSASTASGAGSSRTRS